MVMTATLLAFWEGRMALLGSLFSSVNLAKYSLMLVDQGDPFSMIGLPVQDTFGVLGEG
jgi:hypothetical protein